jgi:hypothetical protein
MGNNTINKTSQNKTKQLFLLRALQVTQDPQKLKQMIGVKTVAEVYRTLDKLSMRKEYHESLANAGVSFDYLVKGMKNIADTSEKDDTRLKALQTILKSVGLDKYDSEGGIGTGSWEDVLLKSIDEKKVNPQLTEGNAVPVYEVKRPEMPESVKKIRSEEADLTSSIYAREPAKNK